MVTSRIRGRDDTIAFGQFGELFRRAFERELALGAGVESNRREHFAADFEDEVILPEDLLGHVRQRKAIVTNFFQAHTPTSTIHLLSRNSTSRRVCRSGYSFMIKLDSVI